jgi:uncharacterized membrane protein YdjX (TVP38/TMEM64 family)
MAISDVSDGQRTTEGTTGARARALPWAKTAAALAALAALVWAGRELGVYVPRFAAWVESLGIWGPVVFILGYATATVAFIPGSLLTLASGAIFGLLEGTLYVFVGATIGATGAFLVARYLARSRIEARLEGKPRFRAIDRAVAREGLKIVTLLRLAPVFPFNLLNYALGLTKVRLRHYLLACLGMIPGTFLYVYYGKALGSLAAVAGGAEIEKGAAYWTVFVLGLAATVAVTLVVTRIARRTLAEASRHEDGDA